MKVYNSVLGFLFLLAIISCDRQYRSYEGYVYNGNEPAVNLKVALKYDTGQYAYTDKTGFFKIEKLDKNSIDHYLMVTKDGKILDSIQVIGISGGERVNYYFIEGRRDTLFINAGYKRD